MFISGIRKSWPFYHSIHKLVPAYHKPGFGLASLRKFRSVNIRYLPTYNNEIHFFSRLYLTDKDNLAVKEKLEIDINLFLQQNIFFCAKRPLKITCCVRPSVITMSTLLGIFVDKSRRNRLFFVMPSFTVKEYRGGQILTFVKLL